MAFSDSVGAQNNPGGAADDAYQPDDLGPLGKPKPATQPGAVPGTQPNINVAPTPNLPAVGPVGGASPFNGQVTDYAPPAGQTTPTGAPVTPGFGGAVATWQPPPQWQVSASNPGFQGTNFTEDALSGISQTRKDVGNNAAELQRLYGYTPDMLSAADQYDQYQNDRSARETAEGAARVQAAKQQEELQRLEDEQAAQRAQAGIFAGTPTSGPGSGNVGNNYNGAFDPAKQYDVAPPNPGDLSTPGARGYTPSTGPGSGLPTVAPLAGNGGATAVPGGIVTDYAPPSGGLPSSAPVAGGGTGGAGNVTQTPTNPATALTTQTLSRTPGSDRFALAQSAVDNWNKATNPQFEADLRNAKRIGAGKGQLGFGQLRTQQGDIVANRDLQRNAVQQNYLTTALNSAIEDAFRDVGVAQQQQGFQAGQQQTAFNQARDQATTEDALTNSAFGRALQQAIFGYQGNPADTDLALAGIYGKQASGAGSAAAAQGKAAASQPTSNPYMDALQQYLASLGLGGSGGGGSVGGTVDGVGVP